jgi:kinetochore protein Spc7/SPC105
MDMDDTASEQSDSSDEDGAVLGSNADGSRRYSGHEAQFVLGGPSLAQVQHVEEAQPGDEDSDAEGEMDMEVTQVVYGGIMDRRTSMAASEASEGDSLISTGGEDQTVDFTIAVGGLMPHSPPIEGAANLRASIGYAAPQSPEMGPVPSIRSRPGQQGEEDEISMEETIAIGGIIGADDTMSTASSAGNETIANRERTMTFSITPAGGALQEEEDEGMDMTVAIGGVMGRDATLHAGPRASMSSSPFPPITRPSAGTPSFARPTVASATKTKRNIFGPSPSPAKAATPRKSGMETAGEVAKRLSFGSNASASGSGSRKRARSASVGEDGLGTSPSKKRVVLSENVFTEELVTVQHVEVQMEMEVQVEREVYYEPEPVPQPRREPGTPRKSLSAPSFRSSGMPSKSPAKSPMLRRMLGHTEVDEEDDVDAGLGAEEVDDAEFEPPTITLGSFLEMAGVQFIEALPAGRRRSSVGKGVLGRSGEGEAFLP